MRIDELVWDSETIEHITRHQVDIDEVYEVCEERHLTQRAKYGRHAVLGQTESGRHLTIILERQTANAFVIVTAREMNKAERRWYKKHRR